MILVEKHAEEIFWLERRIQFLTKMNEMIDMDTNAEDLHSFAQQNPQVEKPNDLIKKIKNIYGLQEK